MGLTRFWFDFATDARDALPPGVCMGCGITARDIDDARSILREFVLGESQTLPTRVIEDVDVQTLDAGHVRPNMRAPNSRGVWFPLGYERPLHHSFNIVERAPAVEDYRRLILAVGWNDHSDKAILAALSHSLYCVCLVRGKKVIGCGRVVGDGAIYFYIQDVIVLREYRGLGLGRRMMDAVMGYIERTAEPNAFIGLMAAEGVAGFYERYGFTPRPDGRPGMFRVWD